MTLQLKVGALYERADGSVHRITSEDVTHPHFQFRAGDVPYTATGGYYADQDSTLDLIACVQEKRPSPEQIRNEWVAYSGEPVKLTEHFSAAGPVPNPQVKQEFAAPAPAITTQIGGSHYRDMAIQPVEYIHANGIAFMEGNVIKYVSRWRKKGGVEDLKKARHHLDLLIGLEESKA